ncbi:MAG TPA: PQQ-binding-like beta-propeller repeat protein [Gemmatimonadales bacterium]|nr:PQQ-binding-like beta-propeller repeat protein [Gemmatimonadales bacterium]
MASLIESHIYVGIRGHVLALDGPTGTERWRTKLVGSDFVHVVSDGNRLFAAARGELFCLDGATGAILWHNKLPGMGQGLVSLLPGTALQASNDVPLTEQQRRRRAGAAAAAT